MSGMDKQEAVWKKCVNQVLDKFQKETAASFLQFCQKCDESGYTIDVDEFIKLIMKRLGRTFDRFCAKEMNNKGGDETDSHKTQEQELAEFTEAAKKLIKEKVVSTEKEMPNKQRLIGLFQRCALDMFSKDGNGQKPVIDVNVTNIKSDNNEDESSVIVSVEMSSKNASQQRFTKRSRRAAKKRAKKTQMTITAVIEKSADGVASQHLTITKHKSGSVSISGLSIQNDAGVNLNDARTKMTTERITKEDRPKTKAGENQPEEAEEVTELTKYRCAHCQDVNHWIESFNAVKDVYSHWLSWHTEPASVKPFQYFVIEYASCYHCKTIGTYHELIKHHKDCHHTEQFAIVSQSDAKKCALCAYSGFGILAHFHTMHKLVIKTLSTRNLRSVRTPLQLSSQELDKRLETKVHKKQKCGNCNILFDTERDLRDHHSKCHKTAKMTVKEFYDNHSVHLICNTCHVKIDRNLYMSHIENHAFKFSCQNCDFVTADMIMLVSHDRQMHGLIDSFEYRCMQFRNRLKREYLRTKVIFGNGLVVTKQNLLNTKYDDFKQFSVFVEALLTVKKERHNRETPK